MADKEAPNKAPAEVDPNESLLEDVYAVVRTIVTEGGIDVFAALAWMHSAIRRLWVVRGGVKRVGDDPACLLRDRIVLYHLGQSNIIQVAEHGLVVPAEASLRKALAFPPAD